MAKKAKTSKNKTVTKMVTRHKIAAKVVKKIRREVTSQVVDLSAVREGKENAEALQESIASREELAELHPAHALYVYAQNQLAVLVEQVTMLPELDRFTRVVGKAEDDYMPSGPPISPLTASFFSCWSCFDVGVGQGQETLATIAMAVGKAFGMHQELIRLFGLLQSSRMGVYVHEGTDGGAIVLRELVTNRTYRILNPTGYVGRPGELWYVRVLPPPVPSFDQHVIFTTPYLLIHPGERAWLAYFDRNLPAGPSDQRIAAYEKHLKWGPARDYWPEFVFEAYANHRSEVIYLTGLPDVPESLPHSEASSSRWQK